MQAWVGPRGDNGALRTQENELNFDKHFQILMTALRTMGKINSHLGHFAVRLP
jgi:hypothetical protein